MMREKHLGVALQRVDMFDFSRNNNTMWLRDTLPLIVVKTVSNGNKTTEFRLSF